MSGRDLLIRNALAGTERAGISDELKDALMHVPMKREPEDPEYLLEASVWMWISRRTNLLLTSESEEGNSAE